MGGTVPSVPGVRKRRLTGDALEIAAGRMRRPDLAEAHQRWLAEEQGPTMPTTWTPSETTRRNQVESGITVVANLKADKALIEWAQAAGLFVRVDRRSKWGNPFPLSCEAERDAVCDRYAEWLQAQPKLLAALGGLQGRVLGCWCHPKRCHGHHLAKLANGQQDDGFKQQELF